MRDTRIWKRLVCVAMTAAVTGSLLAGCGSSNTASTAASTEATETAATEADAEAAEDESATTEAAEADTEVNPALATESGPVVDDNAASDAESADALEPFVYVGNSEESRICTTYALDYAAPTYPDSRRDDVVTIPAWSIGEETDMDNGLELLANIYVYVFELDGTRLQFVAGGANHVRIQATGGEITSVETAYTDDEVLTLCNDDEDLARTINDQDTIRTSLRNNIGMYAENYGYDIDSYTIGAETVSINQ